MLYYSPVVKTQEICDEYQGGHLGIARIMFFNRVSNNQLRARRPRKAPKGIIHMINTLKQMTSVEWHDRLKREVHHLS